MSGKDVTKKIIRQISLIEATKIKYYHYRTTKVQYTSNYHAFLNENILLYPKKPSRIVSCHPSGKK